MGSIMYANTFLMYSLKENRGRLLSMVIMISYIDRGFFIDYICILRLKTSQKYNPYRLSESGELWLNHDLHNFSPLSHHESLQQIMSYPFLKNRCFNSRLETG